MALSSIQKGNVIESQVANMLMLVSDGELAPFVPIVDDAGVDLIVTAKGGFETLFLQVKSRFVTNARIQNRLDFQVRKDSFVPSPQMKLLCVYFDQVKGEIDTIWLIPSVDVDRLAVENKDAYRIIASRNPKSSDKWAEFRVTPKELVHRLRAQLTGRWGKTNRTT